MKSLLPMLLITSLALSACSGQPILGGQSFPGSQLFESKTSRPKPLPQLKTVNNTINARPVWQVTTGAAPGENSILPFIDAQTVYVAGGQHASAWDKQSGKLRWKVTVGEIISGGINADTGHSGESAKQLFLGTVNGHALALDARSGKINWIERLGSEILSVSAARDNRVAFRTIDGKLSGLSADTGELIWQRGQRTPALSQHGAGVPRLVGDVIIAGFDNGKIGIYNLKNGMPVREITLAEAQGGNELERMTDIDGNLAIVGKALFTNALNGSAAGINLETGEVAWAIPFSSNTGIDADSAGLYSSDSRGNIWRHQPQSGAPVWKMDDLQRREPTTPVLANTNLLVVGDKQGNLHWITTQNGQFVARLSGDPKGYLAEPQVDNGFVYTFGKSGLLTKFTANSTAIAPKPPTP